MISTAFFFRILFHGRNSGIAFLKLGHLKAGVNTFLSE
ncbi:hypothetical protein PJE062_3724 [Pseudovibrio sp. JE062]|nr:hypothetical protein PJE062_3724 [Pseudovibrio sp. JE062]